MINIFEKLPERKLSEDTEDALSGDGVPTDNVVHSTRETPEASVSSAAAAAAAAPPPQQVASSSCSTVKRRKKKPYPVAINLANCKYEVVRDVVRSLHWVEVGDDDAWEVYWTDTSITVERILRLHKCQKVNRFVGMLEICRKKPLAKNMNRMAKHFPGGDYGFVPKSYTLPAERSELESALASGKKKKTFIVKPDAGCQGKGIVMVQTVSQLGRALKMLEGTGDAVAQRYIHKPLLINGFKFDLRIYILVLSCRPLRMYIYKDGIVRFCTEKYSSPNAENLNDVCMHLTNYAVNKRNDKFEFNESASTTDEGSKWTLAGFREWCEANGHDYEVLWAKISKMCVKTVASIQPHLETQYGTVSDAMMKTTNMSSTSAAAAAATTTTEGGGGGGGVRGGGGGDSANGDHGFHCFEMLGLDVLIDSKLEPWLVEVNHSPSLTTDTPLDRQVKWSLIHDTLTIIGVDGRSIRKHKRQMRESVKMRLYGDSGGGSQPSSSFTATGPSNTSNTSSTSSTTSVPKALSSSYEEYMAWRTKHEQKHCGQYERIYPVEDTALMEDYQRYLAAAKKDYARCTQNRVRETLDRIQAQARLKAMQACKETNTGRKKDHMISSGTNSSSRIHTRQQSASTSSSRSSSLSVKGDTGTGAARSSNGGKRVPPVPTRSTAALATTPSPRVARSARATAITKITREFTMAGAGVPEAIPAVRHPYLRSARTLASSGGGNAATSWSASSTSSTTITPTTPGAQLQASRRTGRTSAVTITIPLTVAQRTIVHDTK